MMSMSNVFGQITASFEPSAYEICQDECITFTDLSTGPGIIGHAWTFSDPDVGGPLTGADPGSVCFPNDGTIDVTLTITDGVVADDTTISITVYPLPTVTAEASETTICSGGEVTLSGTGDAILYLWDGGVTDGEPFTLDETTTFEVIGENNFGCRSTDEITITVIECDPLNVGFEYDDIVCVGDCVTFRDTSSGDPVTWLWDFDGAFVPGTSFAQDTTVCFTMPGIFNVQLTVTNALGESASTTNSITVFESPTVSAATDTIIELGGTAFLVATTAAPDVTYSWSPDDYLTCDDCPTTIASPVDDTTYVVTVTDVNGCTAQDEVKVYVNFIEALGVADAFSPNGDGVNDVLYVQGLGLESMKFSVYNKYGEKVFESQTQDIGWDGTYRGREENSGVFTWVLQYTFVNGNGGMAKGTTTLIR